MLFSRLSAAPDICSASVDSVDPSGSRKSANTIDVAGRAEDDLAEVSSFRALGYPPTENYHRSTSLGQRTSQGWHKPSLVLVGPYFGEFKVFLLSSSSVSFLILSKLEAIIASLRH